MEKLFKRNWLVFSAIVLGFTAIATQIVLLREFMSVFYGNELVIGIILANWMLLTGAGAYLGKLKIFENVRQSSLPAIFILLAILPLITLVAVRYFRFIAFLPGMMPGLPEIALQSLIILVPFCLISGFLFTALSKVMSLAFNQNKIGAVYSFEAAGSIFGGLFFNLVLIYFFNSTEVLWLVMAVNIVLAVAASISLKNRWLIAISGAFIIAMVFLSVIMKLETGTLHFLYPGQEILTSRNTPYGNLVVTGSENQFNFYENGTLMFSSGDVAEREEAVHYAMVQHPDPQKVLLVSAGISGVIDEIAKYHPEQLDYCEINPELIKLGEEYGTFHTIPSLHVIHRDPALYLKETKKHYDIVLLNVPDPSTAQINRYFTIEFFLTLKEKLNPDAVISISLTSTANYLNKEALYLHSVLYNTLRECFVYVKIIPGNRNYFLASDKALGANIGEMIEEKKIKNVYVNKYYIDDVLLAERSNMIHAELLLKTPVNKDFMPVSYFAQLKLWLSQYRKVAWWIPFLITGFLIFLLFRMNPVNLGMFGAGFSAASLEVILLLAFQVIYGYMYHIIGILIALFMLGLALGVWFGGKEYFGISAKNYYRVQAGLGFYAILTAVVLMLLKMFHLAPWLIHLVFFIMITDIGTLVGLQFVMGSRLRNSGIASVAGGLYSADLTGSALGAFLVSVLLIPVAGIINTAVFAGVVNIVIAFTIFLNRKKILTL